MDILYIVFWVLLIYFFIVFIGLRLVVPFMGFFGLTPAKVLPEDIKNTIKVLEQKANGPKSYLELVYEFILNKNKQQWKHTRFQAAFKLPRLFVKDLSEIWTTKKFVYCTSINYVVYNLLVQSKYFKPEDVKVKHVFLNFVIHQYLLVRVNNQWLPVDPAGAGVRGKNLGIFTQWFG